MNRIRQRFFLIAALLGVTFLVVHAQDCQNYYFLTKGASAELSLFDAKNALSGRQEWTVREVTGTRNRLESHADVVMYDDKGRELGKATDVTIRCADGQYGVDMRSLVLNGNGAANSPTLSAKAEIPMALYPNSLQTGMTLPDATFATETSTAGLPMMRVNITVKNRKVEGQETITTPVGSFNCYKITYNSQMKLIFNISMDGVEWFSPGVGVVKSESYRKGKLVGSTLLTKFTKNKAQASSR